jgi:hypothetical protein
LSGWKEVGVVDAAMVEAVVGLLTLKMAKMIDAAKGEPKAEV